jgi:RNA polymerase sigma-70 factor (ECF subfamily)
MGARSDTDPAMPDPGERIDAGGVHSSGEPESSGERLLEAIRRGDADAFDAMAREVSPKLFRFALHLTGRREEAEDLVQETLVRALPALRKFEGRAQLSTYLARALANLWKNRLRSRGRSRIVEWFRAAGSGRGKAAGADDETPFDPPDASPSPLAALEAEDRAAAVRSALSRLDPERRMILLLREVEELSYEEIAEITDVPVGTVRSRLARAREDLRRELSPKGRRGARR